MCLSAVDSASYVTLIENSAKERMFLCGKCYYVAKRLAKLKLFDLVEIRHRLSVGSLLDQYANVLSEEEWERYHNPRTSSIWRIDTDEELLDT